MVKQLVLFFFLFGSTINVFCQDLNARVQVLSPKVQTTNKRTLEALETTIRDFLNNRKWSKHQIQAQERIECNVIITIADWDGSSNFKGEAQVRSFRPVFNTSYNSPILALSDPSFDFTYTEGEPLDFSDQQFNNNLGSLLAFYAYLIVGADTDSFEELGGTSAFQQANQVVINAQNSNFEGWRSVENKGNRYWLINNLLDPNFNAFRQFSYQYHLQGLDKLTDNKLSSATKISGFFPMLLTVDLFATGSVYNQVFFSAKSDEFCGILALMNTQDRMKSITALKTADPANSNKYENLRTIN